MAANLRSYKLNLVFRVSQSLMSSKILATDLGAALATYLGENYFKGD